MSLYSNRLKTHIKDASLTSAFKLEFKIDKDMALLANMRLINVGVVSDADEDDDVCQFNPNVGAYEIIRNIMLYDGNELIDYMYDTRESMSFFNSLKTNNQMKSQDTNLFMTNSALNMDNDSINSYAVNNRFNSITNNVTTTNGAWLPLSSMLQYCKKTYISTKVFKNLRLVIEFNTDSMIFDETFTDDGPSVEKPLTAQLVYDEVVNDMADAIHKLCANETYEFKHYETDNWTMPTIDTAVDEEHYATQALNKRTKAFDGWFVHRLAVLPWCNTPYPGVTAGADNSASIHSLFSQPSETLNFLVNGKQLLPYNGIDTEAKKLSYGINAWGLSNKLFTSEFRGVSEHNLTDSTLRSATASLYTSFLGVNVNQQIGDLSIDYTRVAHEDNWPAITVYLLGEVTRQVKVVDGVMVAKNL
ncbi:TPA_asm: hexon 2 [Monosiga MELD virus 2]|nr:TPA_asm: hexon 2 [Monosiga MELD virus 2]